MFTGLCPYCYKKISRVALRCPYCTSVLSRPKASTEYMHNPSLKDIEEAIEQLGLRKQKPSSLHAHAKKPNYTAIVSCVVIVFCGLQLFIGDGPFSLNIIYIGAIVASVFGLIASNKKKVSVSEFNYVPKEESIKKTSTPKKRPVKMLGASKVVTNKSSVDKKSTSKRVAKLVNENKKNPKKTTKTVADKKVSKKIRSKNI